MKLCSVTNPSVHVPNINLGTRFEIKLNNNQFWILYASSDITFNIDSSEKALKATGIKISTDIYYTLF